MKVKLLGLACHIIAGIGTILILIPFLGLCFLFVYFVYLMNAYQETVKMFRYYFKLDKYPEI